MKRKTRNLEQTDARGYRCIRVDNKSCQGAKAITTWPRALSVKSRAFPFADAALWRGKAV